MTSHLTGKKITYSLKEAKGAVLLGIVGLIFVLCELALLTSMDAVNICKHARYAKRNIRAMKRRYRKWRRRDHVKTYSDKVPEVPRNNAEAEVNRETYDTDISPADDSGNTVEGQAEVTELPPTANSPTPSRVVWN